MIYHDVLMAKQKRKPKPPKPPMETRASNDDVVYQATEISRAAYIMPVMERRLTALAMAKLRIDGSDDLTVQMTTGEVARALGTDGGWGYLEIRAAFDKLVQQVLRIQSETSRDWVKHAWFQTARYKEDTDTITLTFNPALKPYLVEFLQTYNAFSIADLTKLRSQYSWRLFELVMTYSGFAGKDGNRRGEWYHPEISIAMLRYLLQVSEDAYPRWGNFRQEVIEKPIQEIKNAGLGVEITPEYIRKGRRIGWVKFHCRQLTTTAKQPKKKQEPTVEIERDLDRKIRENPNLWEAAQKDAANQTQLFEPTDTPTSYAIKLFEKYLESPPPKTRNDSRRSQS